MKLRTLSGLVTLFAIPFLTLACNSDPSKKQVRPGAGDVVNGDEDGHMGSGIGTPDADLLILLPPSGSDEADSGVAGVTDPAVAPQPEVCNGIDDDGNGIIDDVDVNHDGVCDCIRIATLGKPGTWGKGDVFGAWLTSRATDGAKNLGNQVITSDLIKAFQIIVLEDVRETEMGRKFSPDEVKAVEDWVHTGGGLMTLIGYAGATEINNVNLLLAPFGMHYEPKAIMQGFVSMTTPVTTFPVQHPITASVKAVGANNGYALAGAGTIYAKWNNYSVGLAQEVDKGHVDMWGDEWITYNSEWTGHPNYQVELFWVNTIKWLSPVTVCQVAIPPELIL